MPLLPFNFDIDIIDGRILDLLLSELSSTLVYSLNLSLILPDFKLDIRLRDGYIAGLPFICLLFS